jgi:hypothetical protein
LSERPDVLEVRLRSGEPGLQHRVERVLSDHEQDRPAVLVAHYGDERTRCDPALRAAVDNWFGSQISEGQHDEKELEVLRDLLRSRNNSEDG